MSIENRAWSSRSTKNKPIGTKGFLATSPFNADSLSAEQAGAINFKSIKDALYAHLNGTAVSSQSAPILSQLVRN